MSDLCRNHIVGFSTRRLIWCQHSNWMEFWICIDAPKICNYINAIIANVLVSATDYSWILSAGVVPCGGPKKSPRTSSIVQIIFFF